MLMTTLPLNIFSLLLRICLQQQLLNGGGVVLSLIAGVEGALQRLKPHQEGLLLPIIREYRRMSHSMEGSRKHKEDGRVDFIASLVASDSRLSDENIIAVAIVSGNYSSDRRPTLLLPLPVVLMSGKIFHKCFLQRSTSIYELRYNWLALEQNSKSSLNVHES